MQCNWTRSLSPLEANVVLGLEWEERPVVSRAEIVELLGGSVQRADKVIRSLRKKRWLERLSRGRYLLIPAGRGPEGIPDSNVLALGRHFVEPYYLAYATAAAHYRFTAQSRTTVWIVTTKHTTDRVIRDTRFRFVNVVSRKFFGYRPTMIFNVAVDMSDPEKTVIDCVDRPDNAGGIGEVTRIITRAAGKLDWERLCSYALTFHSAALVQRFGYLAEKAQIELPSQSRQRLRSLMKSNSRSFLASTAQWGRAGRYDPEWQVVVNVPEREILSEI